MSETISKNDFLILAEEAFKNDKAITFTPSGNSMKPMLNGTTDTVVLKKNPRHIKKYDVVFYHRKRDNALVLHRVVKVGDNSFTMCGDSQYYFDKDISYDDIFAIMTSFTHNGKLYSVDDFSYLLYVHIMLLWKYTRLCISKIYHKVFK